MSSTQATSTPRRERSGEHLPAGSPDSLHAVLDRAVARGTLQRSQADDILRAERLSIPDTEGEAGSRLRSLVAEALGYVGAALALVSAILVVQRFWEDLEPWSRVALLGVVALVLTVAGALVRREQRDAIARLSSFLWFGASGAVAALAAVVSVEMLDLTEAPLAFATGSTVAVFSGVLWRLRRTSLQQLATFGGIVVAALAALMMIDVSLEVWAGLLLWGLGVGWLLLGFGRIAEPVGTAYTLGAVTALVGSFVAAPEDAEWILLLGLATAGGLVAASIPLRRTLLLGLGTAGLFVYVPRIVFTWFGDALGPPVALFVTGVILMSVALGLTRLRPGRWSGGGGQGR